MARSGFPLPLRPRPPSLSWSGGEFDAIVSDYQMPGMDGIAFLKAVRGSGNAIPFILFTGRGREEIVIEAIDAGVDFYVQKGGDPNAQFTELAHKVRQAVSRRSAEAALSENRDYLRQIYSSVREGIVVIDASTNTIIDLNPAAETMLGRSREEVVNRVCHQFICPAERGQCPITDLHQVVDDSERVLVRSDGERVPIIKYVVPFSLRGKACLLETIMDNTERKRAADDLRSALDKVTTAEEELRRHFEALSRKEQALKESEEKYRLLTEVTNDIIYMTDTEGMVTHISPQIGRYGYAPAEILSRHFSQFIVEEDVQRATADMVLTFSTREPTVTLLRIRDAAGNIHWMEDNGAPVLSPSGDVIGISGILRDVTERITVEEALKESEERYRFLVETSLEGIFITDATGFLLFANRTAGEIIDCPDTNELIGKRSVLEFVAPVSQEAVIKDIAQVARGIDAYLVRYQLVTATNRTIWVECLGKRITFSGVPAMLVSMRDVTVRKRAQEALGGPGT